jgi:hypothetical protein
MTKWYPEFKVLANKGEASKVDCAMMEERLLMWQGEKQIYGNQANVLYKTKKWQYGPLTTRKM